MEDTTRTTLRTRLKSRRNRILLTALIAMLAGGVCTYIPAEHQALCHLAAKVLGLLVGSP